MGDKKLGKTHPETRMMIMNMVGMYTKGLMDYLKVEELCTRRSKDRRAIKGHTHSLSAELSDPALATLAVGKEDERAGKVED